jgi:ABC-type multidrug transport system, ATPase component
MITVQNLSKSFASSRRADSRTPIRAVNDLSFAVSPGSIYALLGPNGSGKTTTFRCIAALYRPDSGSIDVCGRDTKTEAQAVRSSLGLLSSDIKLSGHQSCVEILELYGKLNHVPEDRLRSRVDWLGQFFDLRTFWKGPVERYSTGQRQRAALAVSVVHDPAVLLFDEPTNGLDILAAKAVWDFLSAERARGKTILLSTHNIQEAERAADRIGLLLSGRLAAEGSPDELRSELPGNSLEEAFYTLIESDKKGRAEGHA